MHSTYRTVSAALAFVLLSALAVPVNAQAVKIGVFDPARVSEQVTDAAELQASLVQMREAKQAAIGVKEQSLNELRQRLAEQALSLSPDRRTAMEIDIQRLVIEVNSLKDVATQELQLEFAAAEARFNDKLRSVVEQYGRDQGFALILDATAVAWASSAIDVTVPIVDQYNRMFPVGSGGAAPGGSN